MDTIWRTVSFGLGQKNPQPVDHPLFDDPTWRDVALPGGLKDLARAQLGTVGSGNNLAAGHPFDFRAPGERPDQAPTVFDLVSPLGQNYLAAMTLAGRYAYAGRDHVIGQVLSILEARATLHSAVHGAGRIMSRTAAAGRWAKRGGRRVRGGGRVGRAAMLAAVAAAELDPYED